MVSVNNVYQKVLALANKEQRGYITPQEFNLFADQAQKEIFEQYFYDLEQRQRGIGNKLDYADIQNNIEEKIAIFEEYDKSAGAVADGKVNIPNVQDVYKLGMVRVFYQNSTAQTQGLTGVIAEQIQLKELHAGSSPLTTWTKSRPVYTVTTSAISTGKFIEINIYPNPTPGTDLVYFSYIKKPEKPNWTYIIAGGNPVFNPASSFRNFQLHSSEENSLVIKILQLAGVAIKDFNLAQLAGQKEANTVIQEKQ